MVIIILVHPFIMAGQIATIYYFAHFLFILPVFGIIDNVLSTIGIGWSGSSLENISSIKEKDKSPDIISKNKYDKELMIDYIPSNPIAVWNGGYSLLIFSFICL